MTWHTGPLALFDTETTGVDPHRDRIVSAAIIQITPGSEKVEHEWLINPGIPIPAGATAIHGITEGEATTSGANAAGAVYEIAQRLLELARADYTVVGHNVVFDLTMLHAESTRHGHTEHAAGLQAIRPVVDTMVLDKMLDPYRKGSRRLIDTCRHYGIELADADAHGARADALAAGRLGWAICHRRGYSIGAQDLHDDLVKAKRAQAESFGKYLLKQGKPDDVSREWPIQPAPDGWTPDQLPAERRDGAA